MKLLHTSDWHIGHTLYAKKRYDEHQKFLAWLGETIRARSIDALLVSGDVFDTGAPGGQAQKLYYAFLTSLLGTCCKTVVVVAGNHDSPALLEAPGGLLEELSIHTIGLPTEPQRHVIPLMNSGGKVGALCCAVPYLRKNDMVRLCDDGQTSDEIIAKETARFYRDVTEQAISLKEKYGDVPIVATGHLFAAGALRSEGDGVRELYVGSLGQVGADIFPAELHYVALGHIHGEQIVGRQERIRYSGSPLPMSFSEAGQEKCVLEITLDGGVRAERIAVPVFQRLERISGGRDEIISALGKLRDEDVWIEVAYTGETACPHLFADVHDAVKCGQAQALSIRNAAAMGRLLAQSGETKTLENLSVQDVFLRCVEAGAYTEAERQALIGCFDEAVRALEDEETCA